MINCSKIAVIGQGFVGGALTKVFSERGTMVYAYDKYKLPSIENGATLVKAYNTSPFQDVTLNDFVSCTEEDLEFSGVYFICLPTPMYADTGEADLSIVESVLHNLADSPGLQKIAVVKSTVPPGTVSKWNEDLRGSKLSVVFNPEFLTEANSVNDMRNQNRIILGGPSPETKVVKSIFEKAFPDVPIIETNSTTAECVKYFINVQLASRVVLSCELKQVFDSLENVEYGDVLNFASFDKRLGGSHMSVPGHDGISGARGHCFPKDLNALIYTAKLSGVKPTIMSAVWEKNLEIIPKEHRDWEGQVGRAVTNRK